MVVANNGTATNAMPAVNLRGVIAILCCVVFELCCVVLCDVDGRIIKLVYTVECKGT